MGRAVQHLAAALTQVAPLLSYAEALRSEDLLPDLPGLYGWYFRDLPDCVPLAGCHARDGFRLAYIGIVPKRPHLGAARSRPRTLRTRILCEHFRGNSAASTLRLTLGVLLRERLGLNGVLGGKSRKLRFGETEALLSVWIAENGRVVAVPDEAPWEAEAELIAELRTPLNLHDNRGHSFHATLAGLRMEARDAARPAPVPGKRG